jgi:hypothetical protein
MLQRLGDEVGGAEVGAVGRTVQRRGGVIFHGELAERYRCLGDVLR